MRYLLLLIIAFCFSCKKKNEFPLHRVTFIMYSQCVPYTFSYSDNVSGHSENITTQHYSKVVDLTELQYQNQMGVTKIGSTYPDSIYVRADIDGKYIDNSMRINCSCSASVMVELNQAHQ